MPQRSFDSKLLRTTMAPTNNNQNNNNNNNSPEGPRKQMDEAEFVVCTRPYDYGDHIDEYEVRVLIPSLNLGME